MIRQLAPQFFATNLPRTLTYYKDKLGFDCLGTWRDPPVYAIVARDQHTIHFVEFTRGLGNTPWDSREFVVKDCDGRLLAFGADPK